MRIAILACALWVRSACADEHVPLAANFGTVEDVTIAGVVVADAVLFGLQTPITNDVFGGTAQTSCPRCLFQTPPGFDRAISDALWGGPGSGRFLGGVPDVTGNTIAPVAAIVFYASDEAVQIWKGHGFTGDVNSDHKLLAFVEAYGIAMGMNQLTKVTTGRLRPYYELGRTSPGPPSETDLSFFSGHTTSSFCIAAFAGRDLSDWMVRRGANPWLARILPNAVFYGAATVIGLSRVIDQAHYFSDVALGAIVGGVVGNVVYAIHFDSQGRPRKRHALSIDVAPLPGGVAISGVF